MANRAGDWMRQADRDLEQAIDSQTQKRFEWSCFAAQQAAEKAAKALHLSLGQECWGHVVRKLIEEIPPSIQVPGDLLENARVLDSFYIPTRYANGHPEGAPFEHYGNRQSREAIRYAGEIIEFCRAKMARPRDHS